MSTPPPRSDDLNVVNTAMVHAGSLSNTVAIKEVNLLGSNSIIGMMFRLHRLLSMDYIRSYTSKDRFHL